MPRFTLLVVASCAAMFLALASALSAGRSVSLTPEQVVQSRLAAFQMSAMTMAEMKLASQQGSDVRKQFYAATALAHWAKALPLLFPAGTNKGATSTDNHASVQIWQDWPGFQRAAAEYATNASKLSDVARSGDADAFAAQLRIVNRSCDSCHYDYVAR